MWELVFVLITSDAASDRQVALEYADQVTCEAQLKNARGFTMVQGQWIDNTFQGAFQVGSHLVAVCRPKATN